MFTHAGTWVWRHRDRPAGGTPKTLRQTPAAPAKKKCKKGRKLNKKGTKCIKKKKK